MARIDPVAAHDVDPRTRAVLDSQATIWGEPLANHLLYARRPTIFRAARAMWAGIGESGLIDAGLHSLINRRVAALIGCEF